MTCCRLAFIPGTSQLCNIGMPVTPLVHNYLLPDRRFDVITDKGTLDAVGLMADAEENRWANIAT